LRYRKKPRAKERNCWLFIYFCRDGVRHGRGGASKHALVAEGENGKKFATLGKGSLSTLHRTLKEREPGFDYSGGGGVCRREGIGKVQEDDLFRGLLGQVAFVIWDLRGVGQDFKGENDFFRSWGEKGVIPLGKKGKEKEEG